MLNFVCRLIGHRRSKKLARRSQETWESRCWCCGVAMIRVKPGQWVAK